MVDEEVGVRVVGIVLGSTQAWKATRRATRSLPMVKAVERSDDVVCGEYLGVG